MCSIILVKRAAQTLSRGETVFWNPRWRRHQSELLISRGSEDAGRHGIVGVLFCAEEERHAHAFGAKRFLW